MRNRSLCLAAALAAAAVAPLPAAAAQRTFVASFGLDANTCTILSPCRTFTRAMTLTNPDGEVLVLDSAGYGAFTINQSVSVIAPEGVYAGISVFPGAPDGSHGIVVNGADIKVTLRGLTLNGQGGDDGIRIENAGTVLIERVTVANTGNGTTDAGIRVAAGATSARVFVTDTTVRGSAGFGIRSEADSDLYVDRSRIEANGTSGILASGGSLTVTASLVARNQGAGVGVISAGSGLRRVTVSRSTLDGNSSNGIVVLGSSGSTATYRVAIVDNVVRSNLGGIVLSGVAGEFFTALAGDNRIVGNVGSGITCVGAAPMLLTAERNELVGNLRAFHQENGCTLESLGNNAARGNGNADTGTITQVLLR